METCQKCGINRVVSLSAKCDDRCFVKIQGGNHQDGYVPGDMGIGRGDYVTLSFCLQCGQIQGKWPLPKTELELLELPSDN